MKYDVEKKYLVFPTSTNAMTKNISFSDKDGNCVFDIDIKLDYETGTRDVYIDMQRFVGQTLDVSVHPQMKLDIRQKDRKPLERFGQKLRPKYHFTSPEGWINDPNGLVFADGLYHLFYQLNPADVNWGNMHWGYAVSKNLVDWEYRPIALFPDKMGTMFSGGAFADTDNILGEKTSERTPIVLYYTAAGSKSKASEGQPFTQCMAISTDGGETFRKYSGNPIIAHIDDANRDPKVVYSEILGLYVMSLYLVQDRYLIFTSKNLKDWERVCEVKLPEDDECPAFFPMKNSNDVEKWILMGAHDRYLVGSFDGKSFVPENKESYKYNYTPETSYAAQKFENTGDRIVRFSWIKPNFAGHGVHFNGAMSVPQELKLVTTDDGDRLFIAPAEEVSKLHRKKEKVLFSGKELIRELPSIALDINLTFDRNNASCAEISLFGLKFNMDFENGTFSDSKECIKLTPCDDGKYRIRLLCDTCGIEAYLSDGRHYGVFCKMLPDANLSTLSIKSAEDIKIKGEIFRFRNSKKADRRK